jgi:hypothetical protein
MHPVKHRRLSRLVLVALVVAALCQVAAAEDNPFASLRVATNRSRYSGTGCPVAVVFTANVNFVLPHPQGLVFNYHWERSDGAKGPVRVVRPKPGQGMLVLHETWSLGAPGNQYNISETLFVNSGNTHLSETSQVVSITCK